MSGAGRVLVATLIAGTLDILAAFLLSAIGGGAGPAGVLRTVASGPFPDAHGWGAAGSALGLLGHFAIMAAMAAAYVIASDRLPLLKARPLAAGAVYGVLLWAIMYQIVLPLRWGDQLPPSDLVAVAAQLFCHIALVGMPIALIARR